MKNVSMTCLILLMSSSVYSNVNMPENITCALKKNIVGNNSHNKRKGKEVIVYKKLGSLFFQKMRFLYSKKRYGHFSDGGVFKYVEGEGNSVSFQRVNGGRADIISEESILELNRTTGSYPGAGPAPKRITVFNCIDDYKDISRTSLRTVLRDFDL